ncbi:HEPN domain-containing protein [Halochromatium glycolicum]|jgi:HEPN domain-containing protein|uniref:HEPN domain-containing protein n=1 Tax=Halochromatium glycolicum TaxID=85075 RepID=A0AAJ0U6E3_9GAMM|nr:HEPN domain-containing protein [Halochromatium glycolicum]MBK1706148.1 hypothetical protein [Halochromatium glycolicum]
MSSHSAQARALFDAALRDRLTLRLLRDSGQAPEEVMGFHAQQACEKLIKAVLVMHGVVFERTHDLAALAALCDAHGVPAPADRNALRILNNFAVRFRYDTCPAALIDMVATSSLVETLTEWATREIASSGCNAG